MQVSRNAALTVAAIATSCAVVAGVLGMSSVGSDFSATAEVKEHVAATLAEQPSSEPEQRPRPVPVHARLLPNLRSLPPEDLSIEVVEGGVRRLRFASIIANTGFGPVETLPDGQRPCRAGQRHASQVLYHDANGNGRYDRTVDVGSSVRPAGCMLFHPTHDHWHFDAAANYTLTRTSSMTPLTAAEKVSFCWRDNREVPSEGGLRITAYYGNCEQDTVQGIGPGWADVYRATLPDQHLDLPVDLADGVYCLRNRADPLELLLETDDDDNAAALAIRIAGASVAEVTGASCA
jgi:hypothetical protein